MQDFFEIVVVIPVGPGSNFSFVCDTVDSFQFYTGTSYKIIIADNSGEGIGKELLRQYPNIDLYTSKPLGSMAGLYVTLSNAYSYAMEKYDFFLLLKLDTDALVIGWLPEKEALSFFALHPNVAVAGQYPGDYYGNLWDSGWPRARIINGTMTWKFIRRPIVNILLRKLYMRALNNGYRTGESVFGGAYFMSSIFLHRLKAMKFLPDDQLRNLNMGEDHLFALLAKAVGMDLGSLSGANLPFGCAWKELPVSPEQLIMEGKKIIHSTRGWQQMNEKDIRSYFRGVRSRKQRVKEYEQKDCIE